MWGTEYQDEFSDFTESEEEEVKGEYESSSDDEISGHEGYSTSSDEEISCDEESSSSSEDAPKRVSSKTPGSRKKNEMDVISEEKKWETIKIGMRKDFTIEEQESEGSDIHFKIKDSHSIKPWLKLGKEYHITDSSILGEVRLTGFDPSFPATLAVKASLVDSNDGRERAVANYILPHIGDAVTTVIPKNKKIDENSEPIVLIAAPNQMRPTFISMNKGYTVESMQDKMHKEIVNKEGDVEMTRMTSDHPVFYAHMMKMKNKMEEEGRKFKPKKHYVDAGRGFVCIKTSDANACLDQIIKDSKKNISADFFYSNFSLTVSRAWTDGTKKNDVDCTIGDKAELFDNINRETQKLMRKQTYSIMCEIEADVYVGSLINE